MRKIRCIDPTVGDILAGWRYDISGLNPEMRTDYEQHLRECHHCHGTPADSSRGGRALNRHLYSRDWRFVLALMVLHRIEPLRDWVVLNLQLHQMSFVVSRGTGSDSVVC